MGDIEWSTPPAEAFISRERQSKWREFAAALAKRPGEWAVIPATSRAVAQTATRLRRRYGLDTMTRRQPDGRILGWARFPTEATDNG